MDLSDMSLPRLDRWIYWLHLPLNASAYNVLTHRRATVSVLDAMARDIEPVAKSYRDRRSAMRVYSCLIQHEPLLSHVPFVRFLCAAVCRAIPAHAVASFESAFCLLQNFVSEWIEVSPSPPVEQLRNADEFLMNAAASKPLWDRLASVSNCTFLDYLWIPLQSMFLYNFSEADWLMVFDEVVSRPDGLQFMFALSVALVESLSGPLFRCETRAEVQCTVITAPPATSFKQLRKRANYVSSKLLIPQPVWRDVQKGTDYYPFLRVGVRVPATHRPPTQLLLEQIEAEEKVLLRRFSNDMKNREVCVDVMRFQNGALAQEMGAQLSFGSPDEHDQQMADDHRDAPFDAADNGLASGGPPHLASTQLPPPALQVGLETTRKSPEKEVGEAATSMVAAAEKPEPMDVPFHVKRAAALLLAAERMPKQSSEAESPPSRVSIASSSKDRSAAAPEIIDTAVARSGSRGSAMSITRDRSASTDFLHGAEASSATAQNRSAAAVTTTATGSARENASLDFLPAVCRSEETTLDL